MEYRALGRTGLKVSALGLGTGGHDPLGQKSGRPEAEMRRLLHRAFDLGIRLFDTSPGYLESECILGRALQELPREELVVSTKIALVVGEPGQAEVMTPAQVEASVESSLRRLGLSEIDIMLLAVGDASCFERVANEHLPVLQKLQTQGKIRFLGSSELSRSDGAHEWLQMILPTNALDVAMVAHNMINQSAQDVVFPLCRERDIGVINIFTVRNLFWDPVRLGEVIADLKARGVLADDAAPADNPLGWLLEGGDPQSLVAAAYRFALHTPPVGCVMTGTIELGELEENVGLAKQGPLPAAKLERLRQTFGHIAEAIGN